MPQFAEGREQDGFQQSVYDQLHLIAEQALRGERAGHSLQPTLLVNDAYMRLREQRNVVDRERSEVLAVGANIIRRLLVDYARKRKSAKRGGADGRGVSLEIATSDRSSPIDILELHDSLNSLSNQNERAAKVVELKFFGGLTGNEIAEQLGVTRVTVQNDWRYAKAWLYDELGARSKFDVGIG